MMLVALDKVKDMLGIETSEDDDVLTSLVQGAGDHMARIGVYVSYPTPEPVQTAIILMVNNLYYSARRDPALRSETVEGVGSTSFNAPDVTYATIMRMVDRLVAPYRELLP